MIKIYQLIASIQLGGAENVAFQLAEHCKTGSSKKFKFTVVELFKTNNEYAKEIKNSLLNKNINALTLHRGSKRSSLVFASIRLAYLLWKNKPAIVHSHTDLPDLVLASALRILSALNIKKPAIARTIHNTELWRSHQKFAKYTESAYHGDRVASVSKGAQIAHKQLRKNNKLSISPFQSIIYNGCIIPAIREHPFEIDKNKVNIAFCGRFEVYKGIETLLTIIHRVSELFPQSFAFHIIGNGTYLNEILNLAKVNKNVFVYDSVPNISEKLNAFDYLFIPSHFEGLGLISVEASFAKVPVIASYAPGLDETLPIDWPLRFKLEDETKLLEIFENIKNNHYNLDELKSVAFKFVSNKFSHYTMIEKYTKLYLNIIDEEKQ